MTTSHDIPPSSLSHTAIWALERLAQPRYGRGSPALSWSVTTELVRAGFVTVTSSGRGIVSVTQAGRDFLSARTRN